MVRIILVFIVGVIVLGACAQRTICPAFQSAFIYDKEELRKKFSYFETDSTPKVLTASKNKYLVAEHTTYKKKIASMSTIEMKDVYPNVPDSLTSGDSVSIEELERAARSIIDSTYIVDVDRSKDTLANAEDSVYVITKDKEVRVLEFDPDSIKYSIKEVRYNVDQDNYMWYLRNSIVLPDIRLAQIQANSKDEDDSKFDENGKRKRKGIRGFFKNLFKKKNKGGAEVDEDSTTVAPVEKSEFDLEYNPNASEDTVSVEPEPEKKGLFGKGKKKEKKKKTPKEKKPAAIKEDDLPIEEEPADEGEDASDDSGQDDGF